MNASTAGDSAASSRTVGGRHVTAGRGRRGGRCPPPARLPSWRRDPRLERNHGSRAAMATAAAPPTMLHAAATAADPPLCRLLPPQLLRRLKLIYLTATATAALMTTAAAVRLLSRWEIKARPPLSVFLEMSDASCWIKQRQMLPRGIQTRRLMRKQRQCCIPWSRGGCNSLSWQGG
jgi:hypothetical protein